MSAPNQDEIEGKLKQAKGTVKDKVGETIGNEQMEAEGEVENAEGETQETWGKAKRKVGEAGEAIKDLFSDDEDS